MQSGRLLSRRLSCRRRPSSRLLSRCLLSRCLLSRCLLSRCLLSRRRPSASLLSSRLLSRCLLSRRLPSGSLLGRRLLSRRRPSGCLLSRRLPSGVLLSRLCLWRRRWRTRHLRARRWPLAHNAGNNQQQSDRRADRESHPAPLPSAGLRRATGLVRAPLPFGRFVRPGPLPFLLPPSYCLRAFTLLGLCLRSALLLLLLPALCLRAFPLLGLCLRPAPFLLLVLFVRLLTFPLLGLCLRPALVPFLCLLTFPVLGLGLRLAPFGFLLLAPLSLGVRDVRSAQRFDDRAAQPFDRHADRRPIHNVAMAVLTPVDPLASRNHQQQRVSLPTGAILQRRNPDVDDREDQIVSS